MPTVSLYIHSMAISTTCQSFHQYFTFWKWPICEHWTMQ